MKEENKFLFGFLKTKNNIIQITKFPFSVGRTKSNDLVIPHKSISKQHAMFQMANYENEYNIILVDLNALNGTYVNGFKIANGDKVVITTGDRIKFGSEQNEYIFEKMNDTTNIINDNNENNKSSHSVHSENDRTVMYPTMRKNIEDLIHKISLVDDNLYQHTKVDHLNFQPSNDFSNTNGMAETKYILNNNYNNTNNGGDEMILFNRIKNELIPNWSQMEYETLSENVNNLIQIWKQKIEINDIIKSLYNQYNAEIKNFNYILGQYDNKLKENFEVINMIYKLNINSSKKEEAAKFLITHLNDLTEEKKENITKINELKGTILKLETEIKLMQYKAQYNQVQQSETINKEKISLLNTKIEQLESQIKMSSINTFPIDNSSGINYYNSTRNINNSDKTLNDCLINAIKTIKQKDKEINTLNTKLSKIKEKYIIDANNSFHSNNSTKSNNNNQKNELLITQSNSTKKFEEIVKLKQEIAKNAK